MPKKNVPDIVLDKDTIENMVAEYETLRQKEKLIKERKDIISSAIKKYALENGVKDTSGSFYSENDRFSYGAMAKKSVSFDVDKAVDFFNKRGYKSCVDYVPSINEAEVEKKVSTGDITPEDLESITKTKTTYSVLVKAKEEIVEAQTSQVAVASKRKPVLKRKR